MIGIDTNILVYAHRRDAPWHGEAVDVVGPLAEGTAPWAIPWPCVHEFFSAVTNRRIFSPPTTAADALTQIEIWRASPSLVLLAETEAYWPVLHDLIEEGQIAGPRVHDARIAALCRVHGVSELWSADRDFNRFPSLRVRNPLIQR